MSAITPSETSPRVKESTMAGVPLETLLWRVLAIAILLLGSVIALAVIPSAVRTITSDPVSIVVFGAGIGFAVAVRTLLRCTFGKN